MKSQSMDSDRSLRLAQVLAADWRSFQKGLQRELPFQREGPWVRKPDPWVPEEMRYESWEEEKKNVYHVTTNLAGVRQTEGLKSRSQLGQGTTGLGGGGKNESPYLVSTTYSYQKAREIYDALHYMCGIISNEVSASDILGSVGGMVYDFWQDSQIRGVLLNYISRKEMRRAEKADFDIDAALDSRITTPEDKYKFYNDLEDAVVRSEAEEVEPDSHTQRVGFTVDFETMKNIKCDQIAILQLAVRRDAESEYVHQEQELRFHPEDLRVIRYYQP
jgi:hypothetical protein